MLLCAFQIISAICINGRYALNNSSSSSALFVRDSALSVGDIETITHQTQIISFVNWASIMALVYDHIITIDKEVARIWTLRWRLPKFLFLMNRYIVPPMLIFNAIQNALPNESVGFCNFVKQWEPWYIYCFRRRTMLNLENGPHRPSLAAQATTELILIHRVAALYENKKRMIMFLFVIYLANMASGSVFYIMPTEDSSLIPDSDMYGCLFNMPATFYLQWVGVIVFEGILIILTLYKVFLARREELYGDLFPALRLLARDSAAYFIVIFVFCLTNLLLFKYNNFAVTILFLPTNVVQCLAATHMMMNLRALAVHDTIGRGTNAVSSLRFNTSSALRTEPIESQLADVGEAT